MATWKAELITGALQLHNSKPLQSGANVPRWQRPGPEPGYTPNLHHQPPQLLTQSNPAPTPTTILFFIFNRGETHRRQWQMDTEG